MLDLTNISFLLLLIIITSSYVAARLSFWHLPAPGPPPWCACCCCCGCCGCHAPPPRPPATGMVWFCWSESLRPEDSYEYPRPAAQGHTPGRSSSRIKQPRVAGQASQRPCRSAISYASGQEAEQSHLSNGDSALHSRTRVLGGSTRLAEKCIRARILSWPYARCPPFNVPALTVGDGCLGRVFCDVYDYCAGGLRAKRCEGADCEISSLIPRSARHRRVHEPIEV
jgi:hypothetical protein